MTTFDAGPPGNTDTFLALMGTSNAAGESSTQGAAPANQAASLPSLTASVSASPATPPTNDANATPSEIVGSAVFMSALQNATATPAPIATPTPAPATTTTYATRSAVSMPALETALAATSWPRELWPTVERIVACESSGNTAAYGPGGYVGLMQVDPRLHGAVPADAVGQLEQGYEVYVKQGWGAWGCY